MNEPYLPSEAESLEPAVPLQDVLFYILVILAGVLFAVNVLPLWQPGLTYSVSGSDPKVYWFLSRGSAIAAYWLLWLSVGLGISMTNKLAKIWPGIPSSYAIHQFTSILGLGFALFHGLILMGDHYMNFSLVQVLLPFTTQDYRPGWVGIGQSAFYVWAVIVISFYVRKLISTKTWRSIHYSSFAVFMAIMIHSIYSGTDTPTPWFHYLYWFSGGTILLLVVYRILAALLPGETRKPTVPVRQRGP